MDNAFEMARAAYGTGAYDDATLEFLFPQLKESEDERIRKELIDMIKECTNWPHKKEYLNYLEKQKENSKSADFISSDCASDAKCENRWHKTANSLPDNGREVLAKDKLGNTLLARYDGEGWDVSVYDDEDYRCHNGISKWCEIPSEKQKEHQNNSDAPEKTLGRDLTFPQDKDKDLDEIAQDYVDGVKEYNSEPTWDLMQTAVCYGYHCAEQKEQKSAEWDEKDEKVYDYLKSGFEYATNNPSLLNSVLSGASDATIQDYHNFIDKLKILRPQPKQEWSDEDRIMQRALIDTLQGETTCFTTKDFISWIKSFFPSWKPSEEQMNALLNAEEYLREGDQFDSAKSIVELYEQLKKL